VWFHGALKATVLCFLLPVLATSMPPVRQSDDTGRLGSELGLLSQQWADGVGLSGETDFSVVQGLAAVLNLAHFPGEDRSEAIEIFFESLSEAVPSPELYVAASRMLSRQQLRGEAEKVMLLAVGAFPESSRVRTELAEMYQEQLKVGRALEVFEEVVGMPPSPDLEADVRRYQRSLIYSRIGHMNIELGRFDVAMAAFIRALEVDPAATRPRLDLAGQYLGHDMLEEAEAEYLRVLASSPQSADLHYGLAELNLRLGLFEEAASAAAKALEIDSDHQQARYARVRALIRSGRDEEGRQELAEYQEREAIAKAASDRDIQQSAINRSAAGALESGRIEEAIRLYRTGIETQPDASVIYLNLGVALGRLGRREAAIDTFETLLYLGCCSAGDDFLVHRGLWIEYDALGDAESSLQHRELYLGQFDRALDAALDRR